MAKPLTLSHPAAQQSTWALSRRMLRDYLARYWKGLSIAIFFMAVSAALTAGFAEVLQPVLDNMLIPAKANLILPYSTLVFAVFTGSGIATYVHSVLLNKIGQRVVADVQGDLFSNFMDLDLRFFHEHPSGQLVARMISDVAALRTAVTDTMTGFGESSLKLLFLVALMFEKDWRLALIAFCVFPPAGIFVGRLGRRLRRLSGNIQQEIAQLADTLSQVFQGIRQVKAYGMEDHERARASQAIGRVRKMYFKSIMTSNLSTPVNQALVALALAGVIGYGGYHISQGTLTVGKLSSFIAAFALAYEPMKQLSKLNNGLQMGLGAAARIFDMLDERPAIAQGAEARVLKAQQPAIVFDDVSFAYGTGEHALRGVSFTAEACKVTALVGASGSGKSTAMNMVLRFYDVMEGRIMVGGEDVRDVTLESLRDHMALVSQDITIFDDTARANIAYGLAGASDEEIARAAQFAAADEFIARLPDGFDTRLGENGVKLSGGQRQRIAIARAMLRNAPILLLDEATSALDNESERLIQASLEKLQKGRTTLVIAHRLSTVQNADRIVVLDQGRVAEIGTPGELMAQGGLYARMHRLGLNEAA